MGIFWAGAWVFFLSVWSDTVPDMKAERYCEIHIVQISHFLDEKIEAWQKMGSGQGNTSEWLGLSPWTDGKKGRGDPRCVGEVRGRASPTWMWMDLSSWTSGSLVLAPDPRHMSPHHPVSESPSPLSPASSLVRTWHPWHCFEGCDRLLGRRSGLV